MGKFDFDDSDLMAQLEKLDNYDDIACKILDESAPVIARHLKDELKKHKRTGILLDSIKATKKAKSIYGWWICVRPTGYSKSFMDKKGRIRTRSKPVRNMELLAHMEYGTKTQPATPIIAKVHNDSRAEVYRIAQEVFDREVSS